MKHRLVTFAILLLHAADRLTLPQMLRNQSYATAMIGKWHVGLSFFDKDGQRPYE